MTTQIGGTPAFGQPAAGSGESVTRQVKVWDVPTRVFHWALVALIIIAYASAEEEGVLFTIHALAGYGVIAALIFRVLWGFFGGARARFSDFLRPWSVVANYATQLLKRKPPHYTGHNPLGGWMIVLLLTTLTLMVVSGLFAQGEESLAGPWAKSAIGLSAHDWYEVHETSFNLLLLLVILHVTGVLIDRFMTGEKLVKAMFTGKKQVPAQEPQPEQVSVGAGRAITTLAVALLATGFIAGWQLPSGAESERAESAGTAREHERGEADDRERER